MKKPTHYSRIQVIKHLDLSLSEFRQLIIQSGIYVKYPIHRRYKSRRHAKYYSKEDIDFFKNSPYYFYLRKRRKFTERFEHYEKTNQMAKLENLKNRKPKPVSYQMIENRYKDYLSLIEDLGDAISSISLIALNQTLFNEFCLKNKKMAYFNNFEKLKDSHILYKRFLNFAVKNNLIDSVYFSNDFIFVRFCILGKTITANLPYCGLSQKLNELDENEICVSFEVVADFAGFYYDMIESAVNYFEANIAEKKDSGDDDNDDQAIVEEDQKDFEYKKNKIYPVFLGLRILIVMETVNSEILKSFCSSLKVDEIVCIGVEDFRKEHVKDKTHLITDLRQTENIINKEMKEFIKENKTVEVAHFQWISQCINLKKMVPVEPYGMDRKLPESNNPWNKDKAIFISEKEKNKDYLRYLMMNRKQEEIYEEVRRVKGI